MAIIALKLVGGYTALMLAATVGMWFGAAGNSDRFSARLSAAAFVLMALSVLA